MGGQPSRAASVTTFAEPKRCAPACSVGYCDGGLGVCICAPGWRGDDCNESYLGSCRTTRGSTDLACESFAGVMSCDCRRQCLQNFGVAAVLSKTCFTVKGASPEESSISDPPANGSTQLWHFPKAAARSSQRDASTRSRRPSPGQPFPDAVRLVPSTSIPLPSSRCSDDAEQALPCSGRGTCVASISLAGNLHAPRCICHAGYGGSQCQSTVLAVCMHECSSRGRCIGRMCICDAGFSGLDCSLAVGASKSSATQRHVLPTHEEKAAHVPIFVYPLAELQGAGTHHLYQGGTGPTGPFTGWSARGMFEANRQFLQHLYRRGHAVADPEAAALFFVPVALSQRRSSLWEPQHCAPIEHASFEPWGDCGDIVRTSVAGCMELMNPYTRYYKRGMIGPTALSRRSHSAPTARSRISLTADTPVRAVRRSAGSRRTPEPPLPFLEPHPRA